MSCVVERPAVLPGRRPQAPGCPTHDGFIVMSGRMNSRKTRIPSKISLAPLQI